MLWLCTIPNVSLLKGCTNLVSLSLAGETLLAEETLSADLEESHNEAFLEIIVWLKECKRLQNLGLTNLRSAPSLMATILLAKTINLNSLVLTSREYGGFIMRNSDEFHQALASQTNLQSLRLKGGLDEPRSYELKDSDVLVESLSKLINLMDLRVAELSNLFADRHIVQLASSLPKLEVWLTRGFGLTDAVWGQVASLRSLRRLDLGTVTRFTADGILDFINKLGPGNTGLVLSVMNLTMSCWVEQELIREMIAKKVEGNLEYTSDNRKWVIGRGDY